MNNIDSNEFFKKIYYAYEHLNKYNLCTQKHKGNVVHKQHAYTQTMN